MQRCPNCNYILVLLSSRRKYKCAKCSGLFPQKEIEDKTFRDWNERQRTLDRQSKKRVKLSQEEKDKKAEIWRENNRDKLRAKDRENWHNGIRKAYLKEHYHKNLDASRLRKRILYYRLRQKELTLQMLENKQEGAYNINSFISPPTSVLSYQLLS